MHHIAATNVNQALSLGIEWLLAAGIPEDSRNGRVLVSPCPVVTTYQYPQQRVLFSPLRDANPFFHLFEALWMLAGRDDLAWPAQFNSRFKEYSDDGVTVWGAYGKRWRDWFGSDQLPPIIEELRKNPNSRRCVLAMWDAKCGYPHIDSGEFRSSDLQKAFSGGKDVPCNTHIYFDARGGVLNMTVCCRSNDILWGAYGANAVHFSVLQEFMAAAVGVGIGVYRQFSNNYHLYDGVLKITAQELADDARQQDLYANELSTPHYPLVGRMGYVEWLQQLDGWLANPTMVYDTYDTFFLDVARPMYMVWYSRKQGEGAQAVAYWLDKIQAVDWRRACTEWVARRDNKTASQVAQGRP